MVSKALEKSRKKLIGTSFISIWGIILSTSSSAAYSVECLAGSYRVAANQLA